jgi:hypothetical protein
MKSKGTSDKNQFLLSIASISSWKALTSSLLDAAAEAISDANDKDNRSQQTML